MGAIAGARTLGAARLYGREPSNPLQAPLTSKGSLPANRTRAGAWSLATLRILTPAGAPRAGRLLAVEQLSEIDTLDSFIAAFQ